MYRATKCWSCGNWDKCYKYLYRNKRQNYMKKVDRIREANGDLMIRVWECDNFERVANDIPICVTEKFRASNLHNPRNARILFLCDMLYSDE